MIEQSETDIRVTDVVDAPVNQVWAARSADPAVLARVRFPRVQLDQILQTLRSLGAAAAGI